MSCVHSQVPTFTTDVRLFTLRAFHCFNQQGIGKMKETLTGECPDVKEQQPQIPDIREAIALPTLHDVYLVDG